MNYYLTEMQQALQQLAREFARGTIAPAAAQYDQSAEFPWPIVKEMARMDFFRLWIPEAYEGMGGGITEMALVTEEFSRACGGIALALAGTALGTFPILIAGSEEQQRKFLPVLASGEGLAAFCLTEPEAGSDAGAIQTTARLDGDAYILNGTKHFITNGGVARFYTVIANTDPARGARGATAFVVEEGTPGLIFGKKEDKMGIRASATCEVVFQECRVPKENLLGKEGMGFPIAMKTLDRSRPGVAAQAVGIAQGALDHAVRYARTRQQFGQSISSFQAIQFMLADMATEIEAARALVYGTARMIDSGEKDFGRESAMCKVFAGDVAMRVTTDAVQIFGGYGYMKDYPIEKYMRDAKITQIYEGTNQIQRGVIARHVIKESASGQ
ncbi:MAG TPA: acyl-CoA dehydrogenase family protein [bacterium]|nr:acyl-CoA dehydrogenase family protein [bacterium]HQI47510.1 acyl-CoA dehydrogenase family protein [bacterium]HQJ65776.1 acyl-CoA dehydrogenase family protein [bacterium]